MLHSETNAILNAARQGKSTLGCSIYVTGEPCLQCSQFIWQAGITKIIYPKIVAHMCDNDETREQIQLFKKLTRHKLHFIEVDWTPP